MSKKKTMGDKSAKIVEKNHLKELPDYDACPEAHEPETIIIAEHIPEYRDVVFVNQRDPGVLLEFHFKSKTHPIKQYKLMHGEKYNLPVEVIENLEGCGIPIYGEEEMNQGIQHRPIMGYRYSFAFRSPASKQRIA